MIYSSGRVEGRGLLFDLSATDLRVVDATAKLRAANPLLLMLPDLPGLAGFTCRGEVMHTSAAG